MSTSDSQSVYIESYGCQMNIADSDVVASILQREGYRIANQAEEADFILINTCAIRDNAEQRIHRRLRELQALQRQRPALRIGILGCMAERLQTKLMEDEENVSFVAGPDSYRRLPSLLRQNAKAVDTELSVTETYADIEPVRLASNGVSAFVSIMRGCQNFCSYCVVPYTRGRERSRDPETIVAETEGLLAAGYREVTLLGQNVNSYDHRGVRFPELLERVAAVSPLLRVRFATSHPKDTSDELLQAMAAHRNICKCMHLPVQSGSDRMLKAMNRRYTREWYLGRIDAIRRIVPECSVTTDVIAGFCGETEQDHQQTLSLFREVRYDYAYMFKYSMRPGTYAARHMVDDVPEEVKTRRLEEIIALQGEIALQNNQGEVGRTCEVLVEGTSRRSNGQLFGRTSQNKVVVFDRDGHQPGEYLEVEVTGCTAATLLGKAKKTLSPNASSK
ncbi:MAG: tRNA (N6-isopentenyl adenosine(37)-C2)-methylthiotransferase MiaB [Bacteroidales bacterium]|nr:tRNA (N6-isopentenyl adenosine(37)-C2)-methylthiotransferase MiaB [Bacteroidales bacterium]